ncbi:DUF2459 domain-containing protein [Dawidia soli]|uniref:DUF2459 domain-containing protein n=1 Tax=Dawidia soli TaxID=2782352 RepID=A0AAP2GHY8_9BACT|nr:DUF2459 domain-containing protein [Dawidia soli]MBT1687681.1 DUF2459 domain-containing protein [Dawidia soli]
MKKRNLLKRTIISVLLLLAIPVSYFAISILLTFTTVNGNTAEFNNQNKTVYLSTNGVHLDIIIPKQDIDPGLLENLIHLEREEYISFGWGNENFYINTPTWGDLTFRNAFQAMFLNGPTLMHVTRYKQKSSTWIEVRLDETALKKLNHYIQRSFQRDNTGSTIILVNAGYSEHDNFYKANGGYSCLKTCNTWVNTAFKESGLKASYWTPFDFGLIRKYERSI